MRVKHIIIYYLTPVPYFTRSCYNSGLYTWARLCYRGFGSSGLSIYKGHKSLKIAGPGLVIMRYLDNQLQVME